MSISVGGASNALSSVQSFLQQAAANVGTGNSPGGLFASLTDATQAAGSSASGASRSKFDPATFSTLLDAQGQGGSAIPSGGSSHAAGGSASSDPTSSPGDQNADGSTTQTVVNADGSVTTITTYPDGTTMQNTASAGAPPQNPGTTADEIGQQIQEMANAVIPTAMSLAVLL